MPLHPEDVACLLGFVAAFAMVVTFRKRRVVAIVAAIAIILTSWVAVAVLTVRTSERINREYEQREARGEDVGKEAEANDGVGDNVAALVLGWFPAVVGTAGGVLISLVLRWRTARHNPPLERTGPAV